MDNYLNLKGTLSVPTVVKGSIDVSQNATATAEDIRKGKTAAVGGKLIEGTFEESENTDVSQGTNATSEDLRQGKTAAVNGEIIEGSIEEAGWLELEEQIYPTGSINILKDTLYDKDTVVTVNMSEVEKTLKPENIRAGITVKYQAASDNEGVDAFTGTFTADATADTYKVMEGYTYYANGEKHIGKLKTADINNTDMQLPFGTYLPTHAIDLTLYKKAGNPYLKLYKRGALSTDYQLVKLENTGYTITNIGVPLSDQIIAFAISDETGALYPTTLDQAKIRVQGYYHSLRNADP